MNEIKFLKNNEIFSIKYNDTLIDFKFENNVVIITNINNNKYIKEGLEILICYCYNKCNKIIYNGEIDLRQYHFEYDREYYLSLDKVVIRRFSEIGKMKTGLKNNICDIPGVLVGHKSIQTDIKPPPKEKAITEFDSGRRAGEEGRNGVDGHRNGNKMYQYITYFFVCLFNPRLRGFLNTVFKGFTPFTVFAKYWVYSPCCAIYH